MEQRETQQILNILTRIEERLVRIEERLDRRDNIEREIYEKYNQAHKAEFPRSFPPPQCTPIVISSPRDEFDDEDDDMFNPVESEMSGRVKNLLVDALFDAVKKVEISEKDEVDPTEIIQAIYDYIDSQNSATEDDIPIWNFDYLADAKTKKTMIDRLGQIQAVVGSMKEIELKSPDVFNQTMKKSTAVSEMFDGLMGIFSGEADATEVFAKMGLGNDKLGKGISDLLTKALTPELRESIKKSVAESGNVANIKTMLSSFSSMGSFNLQELEKKSLTELFADERVFGILKAMIRGEEEYEKQISSWERPPKLAITTEKQFMMISQIQVLIGSGYSLITRAAILPKVYYIVYLIGTSKFDVLLQFLDIKTFDEFVGKISAMAEIKL